MNRTGTRDDEGESGEAESGEGGENAPRAGGGGSTAKERMMELMHEFRRRQRSRPDLVVRPWWAPAAESNGGRGAGPGAVGFVVEYCPRGVVSAELAVRLDRVRVEGPGGALHGTLDLEEGWRLDGEDRVCPETLANYLLRMADEVLS